MKLTFLILAVASIVCDAIEQSDEMTSTEWDRILYNRNYGRDPEGFKKKYNKYSQMHAGGKSGNNMKENYGGKEIEDKHAVFIQPLGCPGKCLDVDMLGGFLTVVHRECDNCDPAQQWRIKKYKGEIVQLENVKTPGQCACIADEQDLDVPPCEGGAIKLGPCTHGDKIDQYSTYKHNNDHWSPSYGAHGHTSYNYDEPTDLSLFQFVGGRFLSTYCLEQGVSSSMSVFSDGAVEGPYDYCNPPPENDPITFANTVEPFVFPEDIFMITKCLAEERQCPYDWW